MKNRYKRAAIICSGLTALGLATYFVLNALESNLVFFFTPSQIAAGEAPKNITFRIGGMVKTDSIKRDGVTVNFIVTDFNREIKVSYSGILPDLFKEGKGVVAQGRLEDDENFIAAEVLAKHDENYMPPEAQQALDQTKMKNTNAN